MLMLALQLISATLIAAGAWLTLSGSVAIAVPDAIGLSDVLAGYRIGPAIARHTRLLAVVLAVIGIALFIFGASLGIRTLP